MAPPTRMFLASGWKRVLGCLFSFLTTLAPVFFLAGAWTVIQVWGGGMSETWWLLRAIACHHQTSPSSPLFSGIHLPLVYFPLRDELIATTVSSLMVGWEVMEALAPSRRSSFQHCWRANQYLPSQLVKTRRSLLRFKGRRNSPVRRIGRRMGMVNGETYTTLQAGGGNERS